jgi:hypothetical protein
MPDGLLEVSECPHLDVGEVGPELEPWKAEDLHHEHGCAVGDPAEQGRLNFPSRRGVLRDRDHGKVAAFMSRRIGPPRLGLHVDLGALADIQPYSHSRRSSHDVRCGEHAAGRSQIA